nr:hypothetical protein [Myxococcota bacterium]
MFASRERPLILIEDRLVAVRLSLNTPVVSTAELPPGPARAALLVHLEQGQRCFAVVVRSLEAGISAVYELQGEDLDGAGAWSVALDATLSFGETLGFLFDDDALAGAAPDGVKRTLELVRELVAPPDGLDPDLERASGPLTDEAGAEILLDEAIESSDEPMLELPDEPEPDPGPAKAAPEADAPALDHALDLGDSGPGPALELEGPAPAPAAPAAASNAEESLLEPPPPVEAPSPPRLTKFRHA